MLFLEGGRGDIGIGKVGAKGAKHMIFFNKIEDSPFAAGDVVDREVEFTDMLFGFASDKSGSFRALASVATEIADAMESGETYRSDSISELSSSAVVEPRMSRAGVERVVAAVRKEMVELGFHVDDLTDESLEDLMREFTFTGDEEEFVKECVSSVAEFVAGANSSLAMEVAGLESRLKERGNFNKEFIISNILDMESSLLTMQCVLAAMEASE